MEVIAIMNPQRGTGKTSTAVNLSICLANMRQQVLLVDLDFQGCSTDRLGVNPLEVTPSVYDVMNRRVTAIGRVAVDTPYEGLKLAPATLRLSEFDGGMPFGLAWPYTLQRAIQESINKFDQVILDCSSSFGVLYANSLLASSHFIIPLRIGPRALWGMDILSEQVVKIKQDSGRDINLLGALPTMMEKDNPSHLESLEEIRRYFSLKLFNTVIPYVNSSRTAEEALRGVYNALAEEVLTRIRLSTRGHRRRRQRTGKK